MFKRKPKHPSNLRIDTLVGTGTNINGDVEFKGGLHVDGVIHGNVKAQANEECWLSVSDSGVIEGEVHVPNVLLNGRVQGDVFAMQRVELGATANVHGDVHYTLIEMALGAQINGKLVHEREGEVVVAKAGASSNKRPLEPAEESLLLGGASAAKQSVK